MRIMSKNAAYQKLVVLKTNRNKRYGYGQFIVEGVRNLNEAVKNGWTLDALLHAEGVPLSDWARGMLRNAGAAEDVTMPPALMAELSDKTDTSELLAVVRMRNDQMPALSPCPLLALFDRPSNHGNLGTILRSCDALGVEALLIAGHAVDVYDKDVVSSSMGSFFRVPAVRVENGADVTAILRDLRVNYPGFQVVGTTAHREKNIDDVDFTRPTLLLIGNETEGLSRGLKAESDVLATIPMAESSSASSLNVACAATVMFYEAARQRAVMKR